MAKRLGDLLIEENLVTQEQIMRAVQEQQKTGDPLGRILVKMGFITEEALFYFLAIQFDTEYVELAGPIDAALLEYIKKDIAEKYNVIPYKETPANFVVATSEPDDHLIMKLKERIILPDGKELKFVVTSESNMKAALEVNYGVEKTSAADSGENFNEI
ncbi:MAG: hypothetical protein LLG37_00670, partial [Spirochaetia bacterium]|nr:hypothetical protein [Spirochaetia bacterium]